jgi:Fic family protein
MMTLRQFSAEPSTIPTIASWYIADLSKAQGKQELFTHQSSLSKAQGKQELFTHQSSQKLKILREHALIESAVSSNRIEGVNIDQSRIRTIVLGKPFLKDRDEEEVRGYRDSLAKKGNTL